MLWMTQHVDVYESFIIKGKQRISDRNKIMPTMLALMIAVGILRASGLLGNDRYVDWKYDGSYWDFLGN